MLLGLFLCHALFLPALGGNNTKKTNDTNISTNNTKAKKFLEPNIIITEGGPTVQSTPITLSIQNHDTVLTSLNNDLGKDKSMEQSSSSNIVARKGVKYHVDTTTPEVQSMLKISNDTQVIKEHIVTSTHKNISSTVHQNNTTGGKTLQTKVAKEANLNTTTLPHKPLILSNEALDRMNTKNTDIKTGMPLDDKSGPSKKIIPMSTSRHPGMVMPIVITILVVPMFAVLGYMALRRGKEAWKNRHYKRMDFLLDGMYNE